VNCEKNRKKISKPREVVRFNTTLDKDILNSMKKYAKKSRHKCVARLIESLYLNHKKKNTEET